MKDRSVDFNSVLTVANLLVAAGIASAYWQAGVNEYVDATSVVLAELLCLQTHVALRIERARRDPFVLLMTFSLILYYELRILTLIVYPFSDVFDRFAYEARDSSYALVFMLVANMFLYAGFFAVRGRKGLPVDSSGWKPGNPAGMVILLIAAVLLGYLSSGYLDEDSVPRALAFLVIFLNPGITVLMALAYFLVYRGALSRGFVVAIGFLLLAEMAVHTLLGSRSALVGFVQSCMYVALAMAGGIRFPRRYLYLGIAMLPVMAVLLVVAFAVSTFNRANKESKGAITLQSAIALAERSSDQLTAQSGLDLLLPPIFSRAGFFDFSAEVIAHRREYAGILNPATYGKSIVDNILTPGFDVYDQPKIANSLQFVYFDLGRPSKKAADEFYQSDQLGIYGEFYALFRYGCLPLLFLLAYYLKRLYVRLSSTNPFTLVAKRAVVLFVFIKFMDSFGIDWILLECVPLVVAIYAYSLMFSSKRVIVADGGHTAGAPAA